MTKAFKDIEIFMLKHRHASVVLLIIVACAFLIVVAYVIAAGYGRAPEIENIIKGNIVSFAQEAAAPQETATANLSILEGTQTVESDRYALQIPSGWIVVASKETERRNDGTLFYGWIYNEESDDMSDPGVVKITIKDALKNGRSFEEVVAAHAWDEADVKEIVAFMSTEAAEAFPDFSESDVKVDMADDEIGGIAVKRNTLQCLKPCYIEGAAQTYVTYFVNASDRVYLLDVSTNTQETTADFLNAADAVVRTFQLR